jgi:uncharacterized protein YndB with AHSA1/START domain
MSARTVKFNQFVKTSPAKVYNAFTNATALREWICDVSTVDPNPGGRLYMAWNSGYYVCGEYTQLEPDKKIEFTWYGRNEPGVSQVKVTLIAGGGGTKVELEHTLPETNKDWDNIVKEVEDGWKSSLENLASVLETGADLRVTKRPMLGITLSDFNADLARRLGVPVSEGIRVDGLLQGMGAQAAGLQPNDVIVAADERETRKFGDIPTILESKRAGDKLKITFYRGNKKITADMVLSGRRIPEIPDTLEGLVEAVKRMYDQQKVDIEKLFAGVSDTEASFKPKKDEWSAKEVLAHLIHSERFFQIFIWDLLGGQERWVDRFAGNLTPPILATLAAFPTLKELLREFDYSLAETLASLTNLPPEFIENKGSYWRMAYAISEGPYHFQTHLAQMRASIEAARTK